MKVKNLHGTSDKTCDKCKSWLKHWENKTNDSTWFCMKKDCTNKATVGAHVIKCEGHDKKFYIVPLCHSCTKKKEEFELEPYAELAPAIACE